MGCFSSEKRLCECRWLHVLQLIMASCGGTNVPDISIMLQTLARGGRQKGHNKHWAHMLRRRNRFMTF